MIKLTDYIKEEIEKCKSSPFYFATNYWVVDGKKFTTFLTEEEFNKQFKYERISKVI